MGHSTEPPRRARGPTGQSTPGEEQHSADGHPKTGAIDTPRKERGPDRPPAGRQSRETGQTVPTGMRVLPVALALFGLPLSGIGLRVVSAGRSASAYDQTGGSSAVAAVGVLIAVLGVGYCLAAYGTWSLKPWGLTLAIGLFGTGFLSSLLLASSASSAGLVGLVVNGGLCWYLYSNRRQYQRLARAGQSRGSTG